MHASANLYSMTEAYECLSFCIVRLQSLVVVQIAVVHSA